MVQPRLFFSIVLSVSLPIVLATFWVPPAASRLDSRARSTRSHFPQLKTGKTGPDIQDRYEDNRPDDPLKMGDRPE